MIDKTQLQSIAAEMKKVRAANIYYHKSPDGDAIGSAHALALGLRSLGAKCRLYCVDPIPQKYRFLTDKVEQEELEDPVLISVDSASPSRLGKYGDQQFDFCIDHHENNSIPADCKYVDDRSSSCAEIIYRLLVEMDVKITNQMADLLYVGLITDTSCFRTESTNSGSLRTAAELAECGADIVNLGKRFCLKKSPARIQIESILMDNFHYTCNGKVLGCFFSYDDLIRVGTTDSELEGLNGVIDQVEGIDIGIVIRETKPGKCRISVRTAAPYNAAKICTEFGGAGHADRAGGNLDGKPKEVLALVEEICRRQIENDSIVEEIK